MIRCVSESIVRTSQKAGSSTEKGLVYSWSCARAAVTVIHSSTDFTFWITISAEIGRCWGKSTIWTGYKASRVVKVCHICSWKDTLGTICWRIWAFCALWVTKRAHCPILQPVSIRTRRIARWVEKSKASLTKRAIWRWNASWTVRRTGITLVSCCICDSLVRTAQKTSCSTQKGLVDSWSRARATLAISWPSTI